jgi:hypothetical protein
MKSSFLIINKLLLSLLAVVIFTAPVNAADDEATELARQTQNPISGLISVAFEINANFSAGPENKVLNVLNIKPVITRPVDREWLHKTLSRYHCTEAVCAVLLVEDDVEARSLMAGMLEKTAYTREQLLQHVRDAVASCAVAQTDATAWQVF